MKKLVLSRLLQLIIILVGISFLSFALVSISPGDPAYIKLSEKGVPPSEELLEKTREQMGLNRPFFVRYTSWLADIVRFDFGNSYSSGEPVVKEFSSALKNTLKLTIFAFFICFLISFPIAIISAIKKNSITDAIIRLLSVFSMSMPDFYLGVIILFIFGLKFRVFPIIGGVAFKNMIMPSMTLGIILSGRAIKQLRASLVEELNKDYVAGEIVRGLPDKIIVLHILRGSMLSIITFLALSFGNLLGGTSACEIIFNYPGISSQVVDSIGHRDLPMIQIYTLWIASAFAIINFFVDISYVYFKPKEQSKDID
ncbi:hypothetical protein HMPREF9630_01625 [Peptoanaerobacter stomatis]|uniref:ABC transmembrane type-1 domain-containing protein n=1 Tax=Peptoanaerobacter stomatis TaxID=796937 RepID=V9HKP9_9FIRM|nr:ABC transporter permease [Peptoanaerobacter stomatis]EHL17613.1 hypothetical protein HMPREF9630_01625 [Peptoanaerobacter stomatis]